MRRGECRYRPQQRKPPFQVVTAYPPVMQRGFLQDLANTACQMFVGWRLHDSVRWLVERGSGNLAVDLLTGEATLDESTVESPDIAGELQAWFAARLHSEAVVEGTVGSAVLFCTFTASEEQHRRRPVTNVHLTMRCRCEIVSGERTFVGELSSE